MRCCPQAWMLGDVLPIPHRKNVSDHSRRLRNWTDPLGLEPIAGIADSSAAEGMNIRLLCLSSVL